MMTRSSDQADRIRNLTLRLLFVDAEAEKLKAQIRKYRLRVCVLSLVTLLAVLIGSYGGYLLYGEDVFGFALVYPAALVGGLTAIGWYLLRLDLHHWLNQRDVFRDLVKTYRKDV